MESSDGLRVFLEYHRRMLLFLIGVSAVIAAGLLALGDQARFGGFALGAAAQLVKFGYFDVRVVREMAADPAVAVEKLKSRYGAMVLLAIAVVLTLKLRLNVWALAAGVFLPRIVFLADTYLRPNVFAASPSPAPGGQGEEKEAQGDR